MRVQVEGYPAFDAQPDETLLAACDRAGLPIEAACGGFAACNSCRVEVLDGASLLTPLSWEEQPFLDAATQRLACQARVLCEGALRVRLAPG